MFPKINEEDWKKAASLEIDGQDPFQSLTWQADGITFLPIYSNSSDRELQYLNKFDLQSSADEFLGARAWRNLPAVIVSDELQANSKSLNHLANGADGILFKIINKDLDLDKLLDKIEWTYCTISFLLTDVAIAKQIEKYCLRYKDNDHLINSVLFWEQPPKHDNHLLNVFSGQKNIKTMGLIIQPSSPSQEICEALCKAIQYVNESSTSGIEKKSAINSIAFSFPVGINFFIEIAKLKAFRILWFQITQAYGVTDYNLDDFHLHTRADAWVNDKFNPNSNMLKATTSSMAAVMGGCDSLTVFAEEDNNVMMNRIARNVSNILREESHFDKVADPLAGAYAIDAMVNEIAQKAWAEFQTKSKEL